MKKVSAHLYEYRYMRICVSYQIRVESLSAVGSTNNQLYSVRVDWDTTTDQGRSYGVVNYLSMLMLEEIRFIVTGGISYLYGASSVEYSALVCNNNYSRVCISVIVISRVYIPVPTISVYSLRVLGGGRIT